eukprot:COSAG02_NODE_604_length_19688_cov_77.556231_15_plen_69_part_00
MPGVKSMHDGAKVNHSNPMLSRPRAARAGARFRALDAAPRPGARLYPAPYLSNVRGFFPEEGSAQSGT